MIVKCLLQNCKCLLLCFYTCLAGVEVNDNTTGNQYCSFNFVNNQNVVEDIFILIGSFYFQPNSY